MAEAKHNITVIYPVPEPLPDPRARFIQIVNTCNAMAEAGAEVRLVTGIKKGYTGRSALEFYGIAGHPNLKVVRLPLLRREKAAHLRFSWHGLFNLALFIYLLRIRPRTGQAIFLRHLKLAKSLLSMKKVFKFPVIFEVHELFHLSVTDGAKRNKMKDLERDVYGNVDAVVSMSEAIKKGIAGIGVEGPIHVVGHGVKKEWFNIGKDRAASYICYTGSLYTWKGIDTLIMAARYLPRERFLIVGGGGRLESLKALAIREGVSERVEFAGMVPHASIPEYLKRSKIVVLPNINEGPSELSPPLKLMEYMAAGLPIVASDIHVFREALTDGKNAVLVVPGDPERLASGIELLIKDPGLAKRIAGQAKEDASRFTYEKRAENILKVIEGVPEKSP